MLENKHISIQWITDIRGIWGITWLFYQEYSLSRFLYTRLTRITQPPWRILIQSNSALSRFGSCEKTIALTRLHSQLKSFHLRLEDNWSPGALSHHLQFSPSFQPPRWMYRRKANVVLCSWANYLYPSGIKYVPPGLLYAPPHLHE